MNPIEDLSDNSKFPNSKIGYYLDSRDKKIHKTYMVSAGEILGTPVQIIKIPVLTSGLNSKGPKKVAGYNYGIVLPNGQSYIGTNLNVETPINTVFEGIKKSFEGPGAGPKGQEFVEKHKKEFTELKNMPSVFPTEVATPIDTEVKQETPTTTANNDEMSFEDFAALMGANIGGNPTAKLREAKKESEKFDIDEEVKWLSTVLPNIPVEVVRGLIHIAGKNAWGTFSNAGITLSNVAADGTAYHEAFHAVFSLGLNGNERANLMKEASEESKLTDPVELEEWLAERFREYVINQKSKTIGQKIKEFFKKLWNLIRGIQEAEPMRYSIYKKIMSSKYKNMKLGTAEESSTRLRPEEYTPEMLDILSTAKYDKDGNILAPNGKPSNLDERQWVHVRTKAFKDWFGDWENNPSEASKVVDENGEPLVVWHSGMSEIKDNIFRNKVITTINKSEEWVTDKSIEDYIKEGYVISQEDIAKYNEGKDVEISKPNAIYASSERDVSNSYTKKSYEASIEFDEEVEDRAEQRAEDWGNEEYYLYLDFLKTTRDKELASKMTDEEMLKRHPEGKEEYISPTNPYKYQDTPIGTELALFSAIKNPLIVDAHKSNWNDISFNGETHTTRTLEKYARNNGYDGIIVKNVLDIGPYGRLEAHKFSTVVAAMNPNQIKSATDNTGTYSRKNDDIRLRKIEEDNELFLENGYSENWIKNATEEEKEVAKYCIGI